MSVQDLADLIIQTITIEPWLSEDMYGNETYDTGITYKARVVGKAKMVRDQKGNEVVSTHTVYLLSNVVVDTRSRVTLPAGYPVSQPPIMSVGRYPDDIDIYYTALFLQ